MPSIFFTSTKILSKWESSLYSHLMLIYRFLHLNLLLFLVHNHIHASIHLCSYSSLLTLMNTLPSVSSLFPGSRNQNQIPSIFSVEIKEASEFCECWSWGSYIYLHTSFPLVSGQGKYILAPFGLYIMCACVSLFTLYLLNFCFILALIVKSGKGGVHTAKSLYSVFREILILKLGDSINSHIYSTNQDVQGLVSWSNYW